MSADREAIALELAAQAARAAGLDPVGARIYRVRSAVLVDLPRAGALARVERPEETACARRQVAAAQVLAARGVPAMRLVAPGGQPFVTPEGAVTIWERLEALDRAPGWADLGVLARRLHRATGPEAPPLPPALTPLDPIAMIRDQLAVPGPPMADLDALHDALERAIPRWRAASAGDPLGQVVIHGDLHPDNVMITARGPVLVDLEMAGRGPASWDLAAPWSMVRRYGAPASGFDAFAAAYGADPRGEPGFAGMCDVYELLLATWAVSCRGISPRMAAEAELRTASFLGRREAVWTLL